MSDLGYSFISSVPEFMWHNIFTVINTLICGLIVAFFTSTFLKKKEERTRIAGVIVEKRINSEQIILEFLERELFKEELNIENSNKYDFMYLDILNEYELPIPHKGAMQYARIFKSRELFEEFFREFENQIMSHKLWLDTKVKLHLVYMQLYFSFFNTLPLMIKRIPLPEDEKLTDEEFAEIDNTLLWLLGSSFDMEINILMTELNEKIVDSVYKLELKRPKKSIMRDNMYNVDMKRLIKRFKKRTVLGRSVSNIFSLIVSVVYAKKHIDVSKMKDDELDVFLKSYENIVSEQDGFCEK